GDRFKKRQLARLLALTESCSWSGLPTRDPSRGTLTMAGRIPLIQRLTWQSCVLIMASHTVHQIHRLITTKDRPLVFNAWFPFDTRESPVFELIYISQTITTVWFTVTLTSFIGLYAMFVAVGCTQLQKLGSDLLRADLHRGLRDCVCQHQHILSVDETVSRLSEQFQCLCWQSWGKAMDSLQAATLIAALTSQLYVYCWFGSELTQQSAELRDAVWGCNWVGAPLVEQRALIFMMEVAAEFTLSAGGIIPASRHTMMQILNQTYSFLMFLMNFMDN
ncbi:hypothetical protein B7P43_G11043, partial [Cryptotermes secundus]